VLDMTGRRAGVSAVVLTTLVVGLMLVLVMFAARAGPQSIVHGGTVVDSHPRVFDPLSQPTPLPQLGRHRASGLFHRPAALSWLGWVVRIGVLMVLGWLAYRGVRRLSEVVRDRRRPEPRPTDVHFDVLDDPDELIDEMREDASAQRALLLGGTPRNAIVACWDRFEEQAERVRLARRPWETSSEFTLRLLDLVAADDGAVARLERLYHEARFSDHVIDEDRRTAAVEALESIHASLVTPASVGR
jgi:hypothetical protein